MGYHTLNANTTGADNVAIGVSALALSTTAYYNTAVGAQALAANTTGQSSTAVGYDALYSSTTAGNTAVGALALIYTTTGTGNVAMGQQTMGTNTTGSNNVAIGNFALYGNTTANNNVAIGTNALSANTTGGNNTVIGTSVAHTTLNGGSSNILIGTSTAVDTPTATTNNYLKIGTILNADMTSSTNGYLGVNLGNTVPTSPIQVGNSTSNGNGATLTIGGVWTNASDRRSKENISPIRYSLTDLMKLQPVSYDLIDTHVEQIGFIAQDVQKVVPEVVTVNTEGWYGLSYGNLVSLAVKSIQELKIEVDELRRQTAGRTLNVSGYMRLAKNSSQPMACSATNDGAVALTSIYTLCICKGSAATWVQSKDGTTACSW